MRPKEALPIFACAAIGALPASAPASVTVTSAYRDVATFASLLVEGDPQGQSQVDELTSDELVPFDESLTTELEDAGTFVSSSAWQISQLSASSMTLDAAFECQAGLGPTGIAAEGFGATNAIVHFQASASTMVHVTGTLVAAGNGNTHFQLSTEALVLLVNEGGANGTFPVQESLTLAPGVYTIRLSTGGYGREFLGQGPSPASGSFSIVVAFGQATSVDTSILGSEGVELRPNPIRDGTTIRLGRNVPRGMDVLVVDLSGRRVRNLGRALHDVIAWDARDEAGARLAAGVYFVKVGDTAAARAVVVR
jgi:hypothetical protein